MWILLGYYLAMMSGDVHSPYQQPQLFNDIKAGFSETIVDSDRKNGILQTLDRVEKAVKEDNKRLLKPLKRVDKMMAKGELEREVLEQHYTDFTVSHVKSIRKNTKALLDIKKKVFPEEWEQAFQRIALQNALGFYCSSYLSALKRPSCITTRDISSGRWGCLRSTMV